jgi:hypothetical protein
MKKILLTILIFTLFSCSNNKLEPMNNEKKIETISYSWTSNTWTSEKISTWTLNNTWILNENKQKIFSSKNWYDWYTLTWTISKDIEKIEILWENWNKKDSYFLKKYKKWDWNFSTNLKLSFWNIEYWTNNYLIKWYIWNEVKYENNYSIDFKNIWCLVDLKSSYNWSNANEKFLKFIWKTRKFTFHMDWDCKSKTLNLNQSWIIHLWKGINLLISDIWIWAYWSVTYYKNWNNEKLNNKSDISSWEVCKDDLDNWEVCLWYRVSWNYDTIHFKILEWITKENISYYHNLLKNILLSMEEKESENIKFNTNTVLLDNVVIKWNKITLEDWNWLKKEVNINFEINKWESLEETIKWPPVTDIYFWKIVWNNLPISISVWKQVNWVTYYDIIVDINTWKTISFKSTYEEPTE